MPCLGLYNRRDPVCRLDHIVARALRRRRECFVRVARRALVVAFFTGPRTECYEGEAAPADVGVCEGRFCVVWVGEGNL